jgi:hypothetical protein
MAKRQHSRKKHNSTTLRRDLAEVLNRHSREAGSNTPDFILARYLIGCLEAFERAVNARDGWYFGNQLPFIPARPADDAPSDRHPNPVSGVVYPSSPNWLRSDTRHLRAVESTPDVATFEEQPPAQPERKLPNSLGLGRGPGDLSQREGVEPS